MNKPTLTDHLKLKNYKKNRKGETIIETVIALGILTIGITMSATVIGTSLRNMNGAKNRIIAINIAREEIEAMRNIRDTNWLKFSNVRRRCWNTLPAKNQLAACDGSTPIKPGNYLIYKQGDDGGGEDTLRWKLQRIGTLIPNVDHLPVPPPDGAPMPDDIYYNTADLKTYYWNGITEKWEDMTKLYLVDIDLELDTDGDGNLTNDSDTYNQVYTEDDDALGKSNFKKTVFTRYLTIEYLKNDGNLISSKAMWNPLTSAEKSNLNRMRITANVSWQEGKNKFSTQLTTHLTDYLGREKLRN